MGVTTAYHAVDDVAEVNGSIPPMLPGSFLREKERGYEASGSQCSLPHKAIDV